jgi:hypothetical protein
MHFSIDSHDKALLLKVILCFFSQTIFCLTFDPRNEAVRGHFADLIFFVDALLDYINFQLKNGETIKMSWLAF